MCLISTILCKLIRSVLEMCFMFELNDQTWSKITPRIQWCWRPESCHPEYLYNFYFYYVHIHACQFYGLKYCILYAQVSILMSTTNLFWTGWGEVSLQIAEVSRVNFWLYHGLVHPLAQRGSCCCVQLFPVRISNGLFC